MSSSSQAQESWISAFCSLMGHEYFAEVSEDFIEDDFNLTGLQSQVPMYKEALEMILDVEPEDASEDEEDEEDEDEEDDEMVDGLGKSNRSAAEKRHLRTSDLSVIESSAEMLYGLIHQRYITSRSGIQQMSEKYEAGHFGQCPRAFCNGIRVLPVGCSDIPGQETVKLFCPGCLDVYSPPNSRFQTVDGAFFGTTFGCLFFMTFPDMDVGGKKLPPDPLSPTSSAINGGQDRNKSTARTLISPSTGQQPQLPLSTPVHPPQPETINGFAPKNLAPGLGPALQYQPRIYGFRVSEVAKTGPRMQWLRSRPLDVNDLDECKIWSQHNQHVAQARDSEMADDGVVSGEDERMDVMDDAPPQQTFGAKQLDAECREMMAQRRKAGRRKPESRNRGNAGFVNGEGGTGDGAPVRVGGGG